MKRRTLVKGLAAMVLTPTAMISCAGIQKLSKGNPAVEYLADCVGDYDGRYSREDGRKLQSLFETTKELYFYGNSTTGKIGNRPYRSKEEMVAGYDGVDCFGNVCILRYDRQGNMTGAWEAFIRVTNPWEEIPIPKPDYKALMNGNREWAKQIRKWDREDRRRIEG